MNKRKIEELIPYAIDIIQEVLVNDGKVEKEYKGYISSFGASIIQAGLLPTIAFFEKTSSSAKADRKKLTKAILKLIYIMKGKKEENQNNETTLLDYALNNIKKDLNLKEDIINATVALKLALNTFEFEQGENKDE